MTFDSFKTYFKKLRPVIRLDPVRDWLMLVTLSAVALTCIVVWNMWVFDTIATGGIIGGRTATSTPLFSSESVNAIHTIFKDRAEEEAKYRTGTYRFADPSH